MSENMEPKKKKVGINPSVSKPKHISLLLVIGDSSSLYQHSKPSMSVTPEKIPPQKTQLPVIRKMPKTDHGGLIHIMGNLV